MKAYNRRKKSKHWTKGKWKRMDYNYYIFITRYSKRFSYTFKAILINWITPVERYNYNKKIKNFNNKYVGVD